YSVLDDHLIRCIHQLDAAYLTFYSGQRIDFTFYHLFDHIEEEEDDENYNPHAFDNVLEIFKIEDYLFLFDTPLCIAFEEFNYLLKIDLDLFTYDIQEIKTYEDYKQDLNNETQGFDEPWSENGVPYLLCDHICEPYHFKDGITKWPTCSSDINGFYNGGELLGMGEATPDVMKFCIWLKNSFENFHELDYNVLVKLQECWWKINAHETAPFTRTKDFGQGPYANMKTKWTHDPYLDTNQIFSGNYRASNVGDAQENQGHDKHMDEPTPEQSVCKIKRFKMMKYSFNDDEEYITIKESKHLNHSKHSLDAYQELLRLTNKGWVVTTPDE
ncbi:hypothetical protein Tco_0850243, partial [Tanacetum coccineum]